MNSALLLWTSHYLSFSYLTLLAMISSLDRHSQRSKPTLRPVSWHIPLSPSTWDTEAGRCLELKGSMVYIVSLGTARAP